MGHMGHHAIIVSSWDEKSIGEAYRKARIIFDPCQISERVIGVVNTEYTFLIGPDGSKEGWEDSDAGDAQRDEYVRWLREQVYEDGSSPLRWAEVMYGDDDGYAAIANHSGTDIRTTP